MQDIPQGVALHAVRDPPEVDKTDLQQRCVPIDALLDDVPQSEDANLSAWLRMFVLNCTNYSHSTHEFTTILW